MIFTGLLSASMRLTMQHSEEDVATMELEPSMPNPCSSHAQELQSRVRTRLPDLNTLLLLWQKLSKDLTGCAGLSEGP